jgi:LCP family protein required for cell wall assembly
VIVLTVGVAVLASLVIQRVDAVNTTWESIQRVPLEVDAEPTDPGTSNAPEGTNGPSGDHSKRSSSDATTTLSNPTRRTEPTPVPGGPSQTSSGVPAREDPTATPVTESDSMTLSASDEPPSVIALIGSDSRAHLEEVDDFGDFPGKRADVIMVAIRSGDDISLLSIPRDLYVADICAGGRHRISEAFAGCEGRSSLANLIAELKSLTGLDFQHAIAVDLAGFVEVVESLGGYEICTDHPLRDSKSGLRLDAGCTMADGETTLQWLRSRHTERNRDGHWQAVPGVSDLTRNERQRRFLVDILHKHTSRSNPFGIANTIEDVAPHLTIDDELTLTDMAAWIWDFRNADVETAEVPVEEVTTYSGARVLVPAVDVEEFVQELTS